MEPKRKTFSKPERIAVWKKYKGHCGYCGIMLTEKTLQVDHLHPFFLQHFEPDLDPNRFENLMPSCRKCNRFKSSFRLEDYRRELSLQVSMLKKNAQFMRAVNFGQVEITEKPIVFYFEYVDIKGSE